MTFAPLKTLSTISLMTGGLFFASTELAFATPETETRPSNLERVKLGDLQDGNLLFRTDIPGEYLRAPMVKTDVKIDVSGPIIRSTVTQIFENTTNDWVEGVYVFPLPEMAAVDTLKMVVGGRMIEGQIKEKEQAKQIYETAKREGKKASLLTQQRPNMFTNNVANIGPGESIAIQIEYQDLAQMEDGRFSLRFPMTVAPRFSPPRETIKVADASGQMSVAILDPVLDRDQISPPVMPPQTEPQSYLRLPVSIEVNLQAGFPVDVLDSPYHDISVQDAGQGQKNIRLKDGEVPANRDFALKWTPQPSEEPYQSVFSETHGDDTFVMTMLTPSKPVDSISETARHERETIFVIDTSGSMGGVSIEQARKALSLALDDLKPGDRFNIIRFDNQHSSLFGAPRDVSPGALSRAHRFIDRLEAGGGTMMAPALKAGLAMRTEDPNYLQQMVFITDGAIGNEKELFSILKSQLGDGRFFPVGIGSAPNSYFMSRSAKFGRGTYVQIGNIHETQARMSELFDNINSPILTHIQPALPQGAETYPSAQPDLYAGQPVVLVTRLEADEVPVNLSVSGRLADRPWAQSFELSGSQFGNGLKTLWARRKIADLEDNRFNRAEASKIDAEILDTALNYNLVSRLTSMVAVDVTPSRPTGDRLVRQYVATQLPDGWDFAALTYASGHKSRAGISAPSESANLETVKPLPMPSTSSPHNLLILLGALWLGLVGWVRRFWVRTA